MLFRPDGFICLFVFSCNTKSGHWWQKIQNPEPKTDSYTTTTGAIGKWTVIRRNTAKHDLLRLNGCLVCEKLSQLSACACVLYRRLARRMSWSPRVEA